MLGSRFTTLFTIKGERTEPERVLSAQTIDAASLAEFTVSGEGYSAVIVTVRATYDASATSGVRVRWLYSPDNSNFDSPEDAEDAGYYKDLTFAAGETRQRTVTIPLMQKYTKSANREFGWLCERNGGCVEDTV